MNKQKLDEAFSQRDAIEKRMKEIINFLNQPNENGSDPVGLHGNLLNKDGYPRNDIDIIKIRELRHELACLRTDYQNITNELTDLTFAIFQEIKEHPELYENKQRDKTEVDSTKIEIENEVIKEPLPVQVVDNDPLLAAVKAFEEQNALTEEWTTPDAYFGSVRSVQPKSLADTYGILDCDRIIQFGEISLSNFVDLKQFGEYFEKSRGKDLDVIIGRNKGDSFEKRTIKMHIPKDQSQRLGIHFIPREGRYFVVCLKSDKKSIRLQKSLSMRSENSRFKGLRNYLSKSAKKYLNQIQSNLV